MIKNKIQITENKLTLLMQPAGNQIPMAARGFFVFMNAMFMFSVLFVLVRSSIWPSLKTTFLLGVGLILFEYTVKKNKN